MRFYITLLTLSLLATFGASAAVFIVLNTEDNRHPNMRLLINRLTQIALIGIAALAALLTTLAEGVGK
jgi:hypothetical protein